MTSERKIWVAHIVVLHLNAAKVKSMSQSPGVSAPTLECWSTCFCSIILSCRRVSTASSAYTGVIIGIFIAVLIVGSSVVLAKTLYSSRHRICLGNAGLLFQHKYESLNCKKAKDSLHVSKLCMICCAINVLFQGNLRQIRKHFQRETSKGVLQLCYSSV